MHYLPRRLSGLIFETQSDSQYIVPHRLEARFDQSIVTVILGLQHPYREQANFSDCCIWIVCSRDMIWVNIPKTFSRVEYPFLRTNCVSRFLYCTVCLRECPTPRGTLRLIFRHRASDIRLGNSKHTSSFDSAIEAFGVKLRS